MILAASYRLLQYWHEEVEQGLGTTLEQLVPLCIGRRQRLYLDNTETQEREGGCSGDLECTIQAVAVDNDPCHH